MSRQADELRERTAKTQPKKAQRAGVGLKSFNPSEVEKEQIRAIDLPFADILDTVVTFCEDNVGLNFGFEVTSKAFYLIARVKTDNWQTAPAISCWHKNWRVCWEMMFFALTVKFPKFPNGLEEADSHNLDW